MRAKTLRGNAIRAMAGLAIGGFFAWLFMRGLDWSGLIRALGSAHGGWIALAVTCVVLAYVIKLARWRWMLAFMALPRSLRHCAAPFFIGFAVNNLLPLRLGDLVRLGGSIRWLKIPPWPGLASLILERVADVVVLLSLLLMMWWLAAPVLELAPMLETILRWGLILVALGLVLLPIAIGVIRRLERAGRLESWVDTGGGGVLRSWLRPASLLKLFLWSLAAWAAEGAAFVSVALALHLQSMSAAGLAMAVGTLGTLVPGGPGHLGTFDFFVMAALMALGAARAMAAAFALLIHAALWLPVTLAGAFAWLFLPRGPKPPARRGEEGRRL